MMFFPWKRALYSSTLWFGLLVMSIMVAIAILAPRIAPHDPYKLNITHMGEPPIWVHTAAVSGSLEYPLGTDRFGRDILSRLIYGTRTAVVLVLTAVLPAAVIGTLIGLFAGYARGRLDAWIMLFIDMINSLPGIMFVVIIVLIFRT